jgi:hypothetical protein
MTFAGNYTTNFCPNPSAEVSIAGFEPYNNAQIAQATTVSYVGQCSCEVVTPGLVNGEGVVTPVGLVPVPTTGSAFLYLFGNGTFNVSAGVNPSPGGGSILATVPVTLGTGQWQQVVLNGLPLLEGQQLYLIVETNGAQQVTFWVDAVQYEPESPAQPYVDGSLQFCNWEGTPNDSTSYQQYQNPTGAVGGMFLDGTGSSYAWEGGTYPTGELVTTAVEDTGSVGTMLLTGTATTTTYSPQAAFNDFAFYELTDLDPAQTMMWWNNSGVTDATGSWTRYWSTFLPPLDYQVSNGYMWNRAAYMCGGWYINSLPAADRVDLTDVRLEMFPYVYGTQPTPNNFENPRTIHTNIKPTRLNYVPNPTAQYATTNWNAVGSAVLATSTVNYSGSVSNSSLAVTTEVTGDGCTITIPDLIFGDTYIVSAWVLGGTGFEDITLSIAGNNASSVDQGEGYGEGSYGGGYYGGVPPVATDMTIGQWYQPYLIFTATSSTLQLNFVPIYDAGTWAAGDIFYVSSVLLEAGDILLPYFDGNTGGSLNYETDPDDYFWGSLNAYTGTTSGLINGVNTQSYYYERSIVTGANPDNATGGIVQQVLNQHTPYGITAAPPVYFQPYTQ